MKNKKVKFGIIGLGRVVEKRVASVFLKEIKNAEVVAVYDIDRKKNLKYTKIFKCKFSKTLKQFFENKIDIVYIGTESGNHFKIAMECFKNNKNIIVEKPPTLTIKKLRLLNKISLKKRLDFFSIYQNRYNSSVMWVKKYLPKIKNKIIFVNLKLLWSRPQSYYNDWHGDWKMDGGVLSQQGIHYIDLLTYFFGKPLSAVTQVSNKSNKLEAEDTHAGLIKFKNFSCSVLLTTALRPKDLDASIEIFTDKQIIKLHGLCCNKVNISFGGNQSLKQKMVSKKYSIEVPSGYGLSHKIVFQNIIKYYSKNRKTKKPLEAIETLDTLKLIHMMYESSKKNNWIKYKDNNESKLGYKN